MAKTSKLACSPIAMDSRIADASVRPAQLQPCESIIDSIWPPPTALSASARLRSAFSSSVSGGGSSLSFFFPMLVPFPAARESKAAPRVLAAQH